MNLLRLFRKKTIGEGICWECKEDQPDGTDRIRCDKCFAKFNPNQPLPSQKHATTKSDGAWTRTANIEREKYSKDIAQPFKKDGTVNEKFLKAYGPETYKNWGVSNPQPHQKRYF